MKISYAILVALLLAVALFFEDCDAKTPRRRRRQRNRQRRPNRRRPAPPQDCGPIPHLENASALHMEDGVHYACQPGYRLEGTNTITCIDGRWTVAPRCVRQVCPAPPLIAFANPPQLSASGTSVTYTCQTGYRIANGNGAVSQTLNCNVPLQQWPPLPQCEQIIPQSCGAPPAIANARSEVSGNTATYTCNAGYIRQSGTPSQITCVGTRWTYSTLPACVVDPTTTTPPPKCSAPPCGGTTIMRGNVADSYDVGSKVTYTCITGHRIVGQANNVNTAEVECRSDGTWSTVPTCEPVVCGQPQHASNGNTQVIAATAITYNSQYTYRCIDLYTTTQPTVATCQADGMWSISPPICTIRTCAFSSLPTLANGATFGLIANVDIPVGTNVTYSCSNNYRLAPTSPTDGGVLQQITCLSTGAFSAFTFSCVYRYPSSCRDYYVRDNLFTAAAVGSTVEVDIDTDGPTATNVPSRVTCFKKSTTQVGTRVSPTTGGTLTGLSACGGTTTNLLPGVTFDPTDAGEASGVCDTATVGYALTPTQITALLTSGQNCEQQVTTSCVITNANTDANFIAVLTNTNSEALAYSVTSSTIGRLAATPITGLDQLLGAAAACDCQADGSCDGCTCSRITALANGADTITLPLTGTSPGYVTSYARIAGSVGAATPALAATELDVTIGPIQCCETV